jgi:DNA-directed RNA polymerase specialized sigma24 family protein
VGDQQPDEEDGTDQPALEEFVLREELRALKGAEKLSDQEHQVLQLTLDGDLQRTIAEKLGVTVGAVKKVKSRARDKLKRAAGQ